MGLFNNLFHSGDCNFMGTSGWTLENNAFAGPSIENGEDPGNRVVSDHNAYIGCSNYIESVLQTGDKALTNMAWQAGPLGKWYQPSSSNSLLNAGSANAAYFGLFFYTVLTNQVAETNQTVTLGLHYPALDAQGNPRSTSGAGPDYLRDANGNGIVDSGELDWRNGADLGLKVIITRPSSNSIIP